MEGGFELVVAGNEIVRNKKRPIGRCIWSKLSLQIKVGISLSYAYMYVTFF